MPFNGKINYDIDWVLYMGYYGYDVCGIVLLVVLVAEVIYLMIYVFWSVGLCILFGLPLPAIRWFSVYSGIYISSRLWVLGTIFLGDAEVIDWRSVHVIY